jgi:hypothetical protein
MKEAFATEKKELYGTTKRRTLSHQGRGNKDATNNIRFTYQFP